MERYLMLTCVEEIQSSHRLTKVPQGHKCGNMHGHRWKIEVGIEGEVGCLPENGMLVDFGEIKKVIRELDHRSLNDFVDNPTCENLCIYLANKLQGVITEKGIKLEKVRIEEAPGNIVEWKRK